MTTKEYNKVSKLIDFAVTELMKDTIKNGENIASPGFEAAENIIKDEILSQKGFTLYEYEEYEENNKRDSLKNKKEFYEKVTDQIKGSLETYTGLSEKEKIELLNGVSNAIKNVKVEIPPFNIPTPIVNIEKQDAPIVNIPETKVEVKVDNKELKGYFDKLSKSLEELAKKVNKAEPQNQTEPSRVILVDPERKTEYRAQMTATSHSEAIEAKVSKNVEGGGKVSVGTTAVEASFEGSTTSMIISADTDNSGTLYVGKSNVDNTGANAITFLVAGESVTLDYDDATDAIYVVASAASQNFWKGAIL